VSPPPRAPGREERSSAPGPEAPFTEPWEARAFAMAVVAVERLGLPWDAFRDHLKAAVAADPARPYYESWLVALDDLVGPAGRSTPS
jgi:Nitrile hydratase beta subunit, N-terminal